jgi:hypothetical protein
LRRSNLNSTLSAITPHLPQILVRTTAAFTAQAILASLLA